MDHFLLFNPEWNYDRIICRFLLGDIDDKPQGVALLCSTWNGVDTHLSSFSPRRQLVTDM